MEFGFWDKKQEKQNYEILPDIGCSYVLDENHEPMVVYYRPNSGLFCSTSVRAGEPAFFLNIRHPMVVDAKDQAPLIVPELEKGCDGIIFKNYGIHYITAFYVKDKNSQAMRIS